MGLSGSVWISFVGMEPPEGYLSQDWLAKWVLEVHWVLMELAKKEPSRDRPLSMVFEDVDKIAKRKLSQG